MSHISRFKQWFHVNRNIVQQLRKEYDLNNVLNEHNDDNVIINHVNKVDSSCKDLGRAWDYEVLLFNKQKLSIK